MLMLAAAVVVFAAHVSLGWIRETQRQPNLKQSWKGLLLAAMRAQAEPRPRIGEVSLRALLVALSALSDGGLASRILADPSMSRSRSHVERWLPQVMGPVAQARSLRNVAEMVAALEPARDVASKLAPKLTAARGGSWAALGQALEQLAALPSLEELVIEQFLPDVRARVERDKAVRGQLDYQDMLVLVRDALRGPRGADIIGRLRGRTPWALIDEFQDTDDVQWEIFRTVWLAETGGGLTVVGDPKQSIYSFRGADVATYLRATAELVADGAAQVVLTQNHRATAELVEATNFLLLGVILVHRQGVAQHLVERGAERHLVGHLDLLEQPVGRERILEQHAVTEAVDGEDRRLRERLRRRPQARPGRGVDLPEGGRIGGRRLVLPGRCRFHAGQPIHQIVDAAPQLGGRLLGEGHHQDLRQLGASLQDQIHHAVLEEVGLAGAGGRLHHHQAVMGSREHRRPRVPHHAAHRASENGCSPCIRSTSGPRRRRASSSTEGGSPRPSPRRMGP